MSLAARGQQALQEARARTGAVMESSLGGEGASRESLALAVRSAGQLRRHANM